MRKVIVILFFSTFCKTAAYAQYPPLQQKAIVLKTMVDRKHISPRPVDDSFSVTVFRSLLNAADKKWLLFTVAEYQQLLSFSNSIDDEMQGKSWGFCDKFSALYKAALVRADSIINKLLQKSFDYSVADSIKSVKRQPGIFNFPADANALTNKWTRYLKYNILDAVYDEVSDDSTKKRTFKEGLASLEPGIRERVKKTETKAIRRILEIPAGFQALINEMYLNAIASSFDPHTNYFSPETREAFQAELSTESYLFGISFEQNDKGQVVVDKLTPGGAAWKSGEVHQGDELVSLQWEDKEAQDMTGATVEEAYEVLDQSNHDKLLFRFRKTDGTMSNVLLRKEKAENDENIVKGFLLKGDKKIGYILLPGFYTEWENETGSSCANDVAKEIIKLKKENIDGLILDVRYNGGGSIGEALEMTGIFIDEGPLAAEKERNGKLVTLKDPNRGTIYDGPMALMVNGQSASASEMLAASLQDYNRAVIVGSNTYGKATGQSIFPMDTITSKGITGNEKTDVAKITIGKLYRVTGRTAQMHGVTPDVMLPDAFDALESGEKFEDNPLPADTAKRNNYYKPLPYLPVSELVNRSAARVIAHPDFRLIKKIVDEQKKIQQASFRIIPLKAELFEKWMDQREASLEAMKGEGETTNKFTVENHEQDKQLLVNNTYAKELNQEWLNNLAEDIYIQEAYMILADLINLQKTFPKN
ncbi:MAG: carboxy terminal-processing peptidase [Sphingobacteriales bacterium]|nr:carboxy terminal-processing peptidase [Sphingobacteriales bacterium]